MRYVLRRGTLMSVTTNGRLSLSVGAAAPRGAVRRDFHTSPASVPCTYEYFKL